MITQIGLMLVLIVIAGLNVSNATNDCPLIDGEARGYDLVDRLWCN